MPRYWRQCVCCLCSVYRQRSTAVLNPKSWQAQRALRYLWWKHVTIRALHCMCPFLPQDKQFAISSTTMCTNTFFSIMLRVLILANAKIAA